MVGYIKAKVLKELRTRTSTIPYPLSSSAKNTQQRKKHATVTAQRQRALTNAHPTQLALLDLCV